MVCLEIIQIPRASCFVRHLLLRVMRGSVHRTGINIQYFHVNIRFELVFSLNPNHHVLRSLNHHHRLEINFKRVKRSIIGLRKLVVI